MKAWIFKDTLQAQLLEVPTPEIGPADMLVKTVRSSICGSDVTGIYGGCAVDAQFGHETAGRVVEVGAEVTDFKEGDRVWINPMNSMPRYKTCQLGGFSEYIRVPNAKEGFTACKLADTISWNEACLIEPFGVGTRGKNRPGAKPGDNVIVYGAGSIGLFCLSSLVAQGITPVVCDIALSDYKRELLADMGVVVAPFEAEDRFAFLQNHFGEVDCRNSGTAVDVDIVVDCAGAPNILDDFLGHYAKPNARLSIVGINKAPRELNLGRLMSTETVVMGSSGYNDTDILEVINNLAAKRTLAERIITHHYAFEDFPQAFKMAADREQAIKVVIDME
jgi:2-desacetyl-2-hydroxyethyl bacteriochlorophyllide A dehydrogenase